MTVYTIIAYRENGLDTYRGCEMGRSDSAFDYITTTNIKEAAAFCADIKLDSVDHSNDREYCKWELTYLIDGMDSNLWWGANQDHCGDTPFDTLEKAIAEDKTTALIRQEERKRVEAEQERKRKAAEDERARLWKEKQERDEYERLCRKFAI